MNRTQLFSMLAMAVLGALSQSNKDNCASGFTLCAPPGATSSSTPTIGTPEFQSLFEDIVLSSLPTNKRSSSAIGSTSLCCVSSLSCLTMANLALPFCYDKFTTNYFLPDGSYGTVVGGAYKSPGGDTANLETGDYTLANGQTGNIYPDGVGKPNTGTLPIPTQFTASGTGTAIPASALGDQVTITYTTTLPGTTVDPKTIPPSTILGAETAVTEILSLTISTTVSNSVIISTTVTSSISSYEEPVSTIPGITVQGTTAKPITTTITTTQAVGSKTSTGIATGTSSTTKKNAAAQLRRELPSVLGLLVAILLILV